MNIILLYGPPSSGKGTHARLLQDFFGYTLIEPAHIFRAITRNPKDSRSKEIAERINNGFPITSDQYKEIVGANIVDLLHKKKSFILDKPGGSLLNEVRWFLKLIKPFQPKVFLFELHIPLSESLKRIEARYFITSTGQSFIEYEEALKRCPSGEKPVKRVDDLDSAKVKRRYRMLYQTKHTRVKHLMKEFGATVVELDSMQDILTVQKQIRKIVHSHG